VIISDKILENPEYSEKMLILRPKSLVIGIGCKKNISFENLESCVLELLEKQKLSLLYVAKIVRIRLKQHEPAILKLCEKYNLTLEIIPDEKIKACEKLFEASEFVEKITGLSSVAEACSYLGSDCGEVLTGKVKFSGITLAICRKKLDKLYFRK
ncbi:MAG: cobalamin biosynthesis protein, partial [Oscillospiraceae bacterium]|nr:cobalamin biosynthesis protein [Oscillospiraceae bacterium]